MKKIKSYDRRNRVFLAVFISLCMAALSSCHYLDIVPDDVANLDNAFQERSQAEKFLFTCYSYLPGFADMGSNPALLSGDEIWFYYPYNTQPEARIPTNWEIARGNQNVNNPYLNYWDGTNGGKPLFQGIRDCNTFLTNINKVPDMQTSEKREWSAEVKFLKAYYYWYLLRMYGPIPIMEKSIAVSATPSDVKLYRQPVDSCFNYIVNLIDSAAVALPDKISDPVDEMGRITRPIALAIKARILITAASPLFNGNPDYADFTDNTGRHLFSTVYDPSKWQKAADACKEAIDLCQSLGYKLYYFTSSGNTNGLSPEIQTQMNIRNAVCDKWNSEIIWGASNSMAVQIQQYSQAVINPSVPRDLENGTTAQYAPTLRMAELFYTKNGVPIDEDKTWDYRGRYTLDTATENDLFFIDPGYITANLNFDRGPRFYADLGFDGGIWYGQGEYNDSATWHVESRYGDYSGKAGDNQYSITGLYAKKLVNYLNVVRNNGSYSVQPYPWPIIRLADLYLYYSEALNEVNGPTTEALSWINKVRERAGLPTVQESWSQYSTNPSEYTTKDGFRKIIHQERLIEMAFEGDRYWDLRRWKESEQMMNKPIKGWNVLQGNPVYYYQPTVLFDQTFDKKNYFWPIEVQDIITDNNLVQNPGW